MFPVEKLSAGDTLEIFSRKQPYREKFVLAVAGTATAPVTIRGIPDAQGTLPILDGDGATTRTALRFDNEERGIIVIDWADVPEFSPPGRPRHIVIENLHVRNARAPLSFVNDEGRTTWAENNAAVQFAENASGIHIQAGEKITIRNCIFEGCGNGVFTSSDTYDITIEGCQFRGNGTVGSTFQHNSYTESHGVTIQYNHFEPLILGSLGSNIKDRSSNLVVRYNWIEGGNHQLDLVDSSAPSIYQSPGWASSYVYGNVLIANTDGNKEMLHFGGDQPDHSGYRTGTLHFHHNTMVSLRTNAPTHGFRIEDAALVLGHNNIFHSSGTFGILANESGPNSRVDLFNNWLPNGAILNSRVTSSASVQGVDPGFLDPAHNDFTLASDSPAIDAGSSDSIPPVHGQLRPPAERLARFIDIAPDLGAFEYSSHVAEPVANDDSYTVGENRYIKPLAITGILANDLRNGQYPPQTIVLDPPTSGQLILAPDGAFTYRPNLHFTGDDAFQYALLEVPPIAISFLADDPEYPDELYSAGDTLTVSFDRPTNTPGGDEPHTRMTVDSLFSFSEFNIGSDYQGSWKNASVYTIEVIDPTGAHAKLGAISATPAGILPIRNASGNSAGASVPSPVLKGSFSITRMTWTNRINVAEDGVSLSSTTAANGFIAGASSNERIIYPASAPHFVQWVVDGTNQHVMAGLNDVDTQTHFSEIDFAAYTERENGRFKVWESGIEKGSFGTYDAGDTIRIETDGSQVYYLVNGSLRYTSTRILSASDFPFILDVAFNSYEASISEAVTNSAQASITWTNQMNVAVKGVTLCSTTATNGFVSGASSKEEILYPTNFPHFVQWVVDSTNQHVIAGLNDLDTQTHFSEIDFAVHTERNTGHFKIRELGVEKGTFGSYSAGDTIRIETEGTQVHYLVNDEHRYTSTRTLSENDFPFVFDVAFNSENASLSNAKTNSFQFTPSDLLPIPTGSAPNSDTGTFFYDTAVVSISVQATNILVGESEYYQLLRNDTLTVTAANGVLANDLATDGLLSARIESEPSHGSLNLFPNGGFHFVAEGGFTGFDHFVYIPFDSAGDGAPVIVAIRIGNQPPVANDDDFDMDEDSTLIRSGVRGLLINDTDPDFDALTAASVTTPLHGQLTLAVDGAFTYQPAPDFLGTDSFFYRVNDDFANSANATVLIRVANTNDIPVSLPESYTTLEDTLLLRSKDLGVLANDTDADNEALRSELITDVTHGNLTLATDGAFTYSPNPTYAGTDSFQYRARDAVAASAVLTVGITVHAVNDPPVAANDSYSVAEQERLIVSVGDGLLTNDDDPEGSTLIALLQAPLFDGDLSLSTNGAFTFLPAPGFSGLTSFGYRAYDETAESLLATVYIDVNSPPTIALVGDVEERVPIGFPYHDAGAIATDFGDGIISKSIVISGVVDTDTIGSYTLRYDVSDSGGLDATAAFRIVTVTNDGVSQTIPLDSGWNLISLPGRSQLQLSQMISADGAALTFFSQNGGLFERLAPQEKLTPGKAYWTFASRPCQLTVVHDVPIPVLLSLPGKAFSLIGPVNLNPWPGPEVPRTLMCWDSRFRTLPPTADLKPFRGYIIYLETGGQFTLR